MNTILALIASLLATFSLSSFVNRIFNITDLINSTIAGGIIISMASGIIINPAGAMIMGAFGSIISTFTGNYIYRSNRNVFSQIHLRDNLHVLILHGIIGIIGAIFSAIVINFYNYSPLANSIQINSILISRRNII